MYDCACTCCWWQKIFDNLLRVHWPATNLSKHISVKALNDNNLLINCSIRQQLLIIFYEYWCCRSLTWDIILYSDGCCFPIIIAVPAIFEATGDLISSATDSSCLWDTTERAVQSRRAMPRCVFYFGGDKTRSVCRQVSNQFLLLAKRRMPHSL